MGPRSDERGNEEKVSKMPREEVLLQWGRAQMSAEILEEGVRLLREAHASMGPRSDERGNSIMLCNPVDRCFGFNGAALR